MKKDNCRLCNKKEINILYLFVCNKCNNLILCSECQIKHYMNNIKTHDYNSSFCSYYNYLKKSNEIKNIEDLNNNNKNEITTNNNVLKQTIFLNKTKENDTINNHNKTEQNKINIIEVTKNDNNNNNEKNKNNNNIFLNEKKDTFINIIQITKYNNILIKKSNTKNLIENKNNQENDNNINNNNEIIDINKDFIIDKNFIQYNKICENFKTSLLCIFEKFEEINNNNLANQLKVNLLLKIEEYFEIIIKTLHNENFKNKKIDKIKEENQNNISKKILTENKTKDVQSSEDSTEFLSKKRKNLI